MDNSPKMQQLKDIIYENNQRLEDVLSELESRVDVLLSFPEEAPDDWATSQDR
jgi:hypothetical protein